MNEDLIILGNGFDLACGLKSSYGDFYADRIDSETESNLEKIRSAFINLYNKKDFFNNYIDCTSIEKSFDIEILLDICSISKTNVHSGKIKNLTFWDLIFFYSKLTNENEWNAIENRIYSFLLPIEPEKLIFNQSLECLSSIDLMNSKDVDFKLIKLGNRNHMNGLGITKLIMAIAKRFFSNERFAKKTNQEFLLSELGLLEDGFTYYLSQEVHHNSLYEEKSRGLLNKLEKSNNDLSSQKKYSVLSFNYTSIQTEEALRYENVHGSLEHSDIIFGIDQKNIEFPNYAYKYTKTFRQMISNNHTKKQDTILPNKEKIDYIKFFGHSLSDLDYSYFQSIFDFYEIYSSSVILIFFYRPFEGRTSKDLQEEQADLVTKLLEEYGNTLTNKDHGKNLIHKLLLEQRLIITEI